MKLRNETTTSLRHRYRCVRNDIRFSIGIGMLLMALCLPSANAGTITTYTYTGVVQESIGDAEISFGGRGGIVNISSGGVLLESVKRGEQL